MTKRPHTYAVLTTQRPWLQKEVDSQILGLAELSPCHCGGLDVSRVQDRAVLTSVIFCKGAQPREATDGSRSQNEGPHQLHQIRQPGAQQTVAVVVFTGTLFIVASGWLPQKHPPLTLHSPKDSG